MSLEVQVPLPLIGPAGAWFASLILSFISNARTASEVDGEVLEWVATPKRVIAAIVNELVDQSPVENHERLSRVLHHELTRQEGKRGAQLAVPVDIQGAPSSERIREIAVAIAENWGVDVKVTIDHVASEEEQAEYPVVLVTIGDVPQTTDWIGDKPIYGGIIDTIVNTVITSAVGTVTSMGTQSLVNSLGGEPRLARLVRRYKRAEERGDEATAREVRSKITKTASRIKGRKVDWSEVEGIIEGQ